MIFPCFKSSRGLPLHLELQPRCPKITSEQSLPTSPIVSLAAQTFLFPTSWSLFLPWGLSTGSSFHIHNHLPKIAVICLALILHDFLLDSDLFEKCYLVHHR